MLLVVTSPFAAAKNFTASDVREIFPDYKNHPANGAPVGLVLRIENCPGVLLMDDNLTIRYILLLPAEKGKRSAKIMEKAKPTAERLQQYLSRKFCKTELLPFSDGESGYVLVPRYSSHAASSLSITGQPTIRAIARLQDKGGLFHRCDNGELTLKLPCPATAGEYCFVTLLLSRSYAHVIEFTPGRTARRSDDKLAESAKSVLNLPYMYTAKSSTHSAQLKDLRSSTGASKCVAATASDVALVSYRNRYYVGAEQDLKDYIRGKKRPSRADKWEFPTASAPIPEPEEESPSGGGTGDTPGSAATMAALYKYFGCTTPVVKNDIAYLRLRGCKVLVPLPHRDGADTEAKLALPVRYIIVRSDQGSHVASKKYADALVEMAKPGSAGTTIHMSQGVAEKLVYTGVSPRHKPSASELGELFSDEEFAGVPCLDWPERTIKGEPAPAGLQELLDAAAPAPAPPADTKPLSPDAAMKDYIEYLRRLMK